MLVDFGRFWDQFLVNFRSRNPFASATLRRTGFYTNLKLFFHKMIRLQHLKNMKKQQVFLCFLTILACARHTNYRATVMRFASFSASKMH